MFALNISKDNRILSATYQKYANAHSVLVDVLPEGNIVDYLIVDNEYIYSPRLVENSQNINLDIYDELEAAYQEGVNSI